MIHPAPITISAAPGGSSETKSATNLAPGKLSKTPKLQKGNDSEVAHELGRLVRDAQDGTRRILICGLFIETLVANLKHGQFGPWVEAHKEEIGVGYPSICGWRQFASETLAFLKIQNSNALEFSIPLHEVLALPASEVPEDAREVRAKIDELISGKSVKQLMFQFREGEVVDDKLVRSGRGGDRTAFRVPKTHEEKFQAAVAMAKTDATTIAETAEEMARKQTYRLLADAELEGLIAYMEELLAPLNKWRATPKRDRQALALELK